MRPLVFCLFGLLLTGCSSGVLISIPENYQSPDQTSQGFLVGSLGATTIWPSTGENLQTTLIFRSTESNEHITVSNDNKDSDFRTTNSTSSLFTVPLPAGTYQLHSVTFKGTDGRKTVQTQPDKPLNIRFQILSGEVTYLGQFIASSQVSKSPLWNTEYPNGRGYLTHSYAVKRDKDLLYKRHPELTSMRFQTASVKDSDSHLLKIETKNGPPS